MSAGLSRSFAWIFYFSGSDPSLVSYALASPLRSCYFIWLSDGLTSRRLSKL